MTLDLQPVRVQTGFEDEEGRLVFADGRLVAILVRLSDQQERLAGLWFYEHGFGPFDGPTHPTFETLEAALAWIEQRRSQARLAAPLPPIIGEP